VKRNAVAWSLILSFIKLVDAIDYQFVIRDKHVGPLYGTCCILPHYSDSPDFLLPREHVS
jgi:hypothetical protein